jgi:hypothetical protein
MVMPSFARAATNASSVESADAGAAESSAAADSRTAQTIDHFHFPGPTFIWVTDFSLCGPNRLRVKNDSQIKTAEIEAFFFAASSTFFFTASRYAKPERREVCRPLNVGRRILAGPAAVRQALVEQRE